MKELITVIVPFLFIGGYVMTLYAESKEKGTEISLEEIRSIEMDDENQVFVPPYTSPPYQMSLSTIPKFLRSKDTKYYILQFKGRNADRDHKTYDKFCKETEDIIDEIYDFVSGNQLLVRLKKGADIENLRKNAAIDQIGPYHPIFKLRLPFANKILNQQEIHLSRHKFHLILFGGENLGVIVDKIKKADWQVSINGDGVTKTGDVLEVAKSYPIWKDFVSLANIEGIVVIVPIPEYTID